MTPKPFKLAMIQMYVHGGEKTKNLLHAIDLIAEAASQGADIALLPECMDLGWTHPTARTEAGAIPGGSVCETLSAAAKEHQIYVCSGLTERDGEKIFNAAVLINPSGEVLIKHRKLNELDIAHDLYAQGDRLNLAETPYGMIGLMICADARATDHLLSRSLCYMGADVILSPSAWAVPPDHDNQQTPYGAEWQDAYGPVAKEFSVPIIGVSNVGPVNGGPWESWNCIGCSLAVDAEGEALIQGPYGVDAEQILYVDIQAPPRPARGNEWKSLNS